MAINEIDNTTSVLADIQQGVELGLELACGVATGYAKISKAMGGRCPVKTGRLRNSIAYEVNGDTGRIGSEVEYAQPQEAKNGFLVHSVSDHISELQAAFDRGFTK